MVKSRIETATCGTRGTKRRISRMPANSPGYQRRERIERFDLRQHFVGDERSFGELPPP